MISARKLLIASGLLLAIWGMAYGFFYAVFVEHQTLDRMGGALASGFTFAAQRNLPAADAAFGEFTNISYAYVRQVDAHGHWIGLSMLLVLFGIVFHRLNASPKTQLWLAWGLVCGAVVFPLGVLMESFNTGWGPRLVAVFGSAVMILALAATTVAFAIEDVSKPSDHYLSR